MDDHQTYFQGSFVQNRTEMKFFPIFEQNHGLPSLKKGCKINIFLSTKTCFLTGWSTNFILRPLSQNKQRGNYHFWPKSFEIHIFIIQEALFSQLVDQFISLLADFMTYWFTFLITAQLGYRRIDWISKWFLTLTLFTNWMNDLSGLYGSWWIAWLCYM